MLFIIENDFWVSELIISCCLPTLCLF